MPSGTILLYSTRMLPKLRTTAGSLRTSKRELIATWSLPRVMTCHADGPVVSQHTLGTRGGPRTRGKNEFRVSVIE